MNRETVLKHSKSIRLDQKVLQDFTDLIVEFCTIRGLSEHISVIIQLLQQPIIGEQIINEVLGYFEKEFKIIKLERINVINQGIFGNVENKQLINIY